MDRKFVGDELVVVATVVMTLMHWNMMALSILSKGSTMCFLPTSHDVCFLPTSHDVTGAFLRCHDVKSNAGNGGEGRGGGRGARRLAKVHALVAASCCNLASHTWIKDSRSEMAKHAIPV